MKIFAYKDVGALYELLESRTRRGNAEISGRVASILARVAEGGDAAVKAVTRETDGVELASLESCLRPRRLDRLAAQTPPALYETMEKAAANIRRYHEKQKSTGYELREPGRLLGRIVRPLRRVGVYVPGGTAAYPSTVLMNCIPAAVAGVEEIVIATPGQARGGIAPGRSGGEKSPASAVWSPSAARRRSPRSRTAPRRCRASIRLSARATSTSPRRKSSSSAAWTSI